MRTRAGHDERRILTADQGCCRRVHSELARRELGTEEERGHAGLLVCPHVMYVSPPILGVDANANK